MRFLKKEDGSVTVEFVIWLPVVLALFLLAVDATFIFLGAGNMWQTSREAARVVSRYGMTEAEAETWVANRASFTDFTPAVDITFETGDVIVRTSMPVRAMTPFGMFGFADDAAYSTEVRHAMEPV